MISYAWMAQKKREQGTIRQVRRYVSFFELEHGTSLAARSSSVPGETNTRDGGSLSLVVVNYRTTADQYYESLPAAA